MGAWSCDFVGNDTFQDEIGDWESLSDSDKVKAFNSALQKATVETNSFLILEDEPIDPDPDKDYFIPIVNPEQYYEQRELFLGFVQHFIESNNHQLLSKSVLETALVILRQFTHAEIINTQGWTNIQERFEEIYKLQIKVKNLLSKFGN